MGINTLIWSGSDTPVCGEFEDDGVVVDGNEVRDEDYVEVWRAIYYRADGRVCSHIIEM